MDVSEFPSVPCPECGSRLVVEQGKTTSCKCGAQVTLPAVEHREKKIPASESK